MPLQISGRRYSDAKTFSILFDLKEPTEIGALRENLNGSSVLRTKLTYETPIDSHVTPFLCYLIVEDHTNDCHEESQRIGISAYKEHDRFITKL